MKERPIIFSSEMVKAILEGRKSQTRRVVKPQPTKCSFCHKPFNQWDENCDNEGKHDIYSKCPYGKVGDRLWVRETFAYFERFESYNTGHIEFEQVSVPKKPAERSVIKYEYGVPVYACQKCYEWHTADMSDCPETFYWVSPLFMPRWASRITLEITDIRVKRLREISDNEAFLEGYPYGTLKERSRAKIDVIPTPKRWFIDLWNSLAKKGFKWENNPWVWVISFRRVA